jgi:hypothetical protein
MSFDPRDPPDPYDDPSAGFAGAPQSRQDVPRDLGDYRGPLDPDAAGNQRQAARGKVIGPAVFLLLAGFLNFLVGGYLVLNSIVIYTMPPAAFEQMIERSQPQNAQQMKQLKQQGIDMQVVCVWIYSILGVLTFLAGMLMVAGGGFMLTLRMWGLAVFASILALISPGGCCCILGLVGGIWGLVSLLNPDVRAAFR